MGLESKTIYNKMVADFDQLVAEKMPPLGIQYLINHKLWFSVQEGRVHPVFFRWDGLHLSPIGKDAIARSWMDAILQLK
jgi:lysophospholipase L1-like esterase